MSAFSPLTTWLESFSTSMLWGEIHGGGLGDGGRSSGWDWIFGPILQDAEAHISVRASAEPLRTGQLGTGNASISIQAQGRLKPENYGRFPLVSWLEQGGASLVLPISQGGGLGDGGLHTWHDWVFGSPVSMEGEAFVQIIASATTLRLGLGTADTSVSITPKGNLLAVLGVSFDPYNTKQEVKDHTTFSNSNLTLTVEDFDYGFKGLVKGTTAHRFGKWYFEYVTVATTMFGYGVTSPTTDLLGSNPQNANTNWFVHEDFKWNGPTTFVTRNYSATRFGVALDLDAGKIWFRENGTWMESGDPATGANPSFSNVVGPVLPLTVWYPQAGAMTANFGGSAFVDTPPAGFQAWDEPEPLPAGNCSLSITTQGTLGFDVTWLGTAATSVSVACEGALTLSSSLVFSGGIELSIAAEGTLSVPRTWLGEADTSLTITPSGTLTQRTAFSIAAHLTVLALGDLSGTRMMIGNTTISITLGGTIGYEEIHATAALTVPAPILTAGANDEDNASVNLTIPAPLLTAFGSGQATLSVPAPILTAAGTVQVFASVTMEVPAPELTATASTPTGASVTLEVPAPTLTASTGAYASLEVLAPQLTATGSVGHLARVALTLPFIELTATAKVGGLATVSLLIPAPTLDASGIVGAVGHVALVLPAIRLTAYASVSPGVGLDATAVATETTYAVNLTTGAVTTLLLGELTRLVTAHGRLYGLRGDELVRLDGNTDGAALIPATVRFAPQTFGSNRAKRLSTVYLESREDDGLTLDVIADEQTAWRYQTATDTAPAYGTHKVKVGRGVKFHTAGLVVKNRNGGKMDIGGMELLVDTGAPRPRS